MDYNTLETTVLSPPTERGYWWAKLYSVLGTYKDIMLDAAKQAVKARMPSQAPLDALGFLGQERAIPRNPADTDSVYRANLVDPWTMWEFAGTSLRIVERVRATYGLTTVTLTPWRNYVALYGAIPAPWTLWYSAFWVFIAQPNPWVTDGNWGDPGYWGDGPDHTMAQPGQGTWGSSASFSEISFIRGAINRWKPAHEICAEIPVALAVGSVRWGGA